MCFSQQSPLTNYFDDLKKMVGEVEKQSNIALEKCVTQNPTINYAYNTISNVINPSSMDAKAYLKNEPLKAVYISTKNRTKFPTIYNSKGILGAPFAKNTTFRVIFSQDSDNKIYHFFLNWN